MATLDADDRIRAELHSLERDIENKKHSLTAASAARHAQRVLTPRSRILSFSKFMDEPRNNTRSTSPFKKAFDVNHEDTRPNSTTKPTPSFAAMHDAMDRKSDSPITPSRSIPTKRSESISPILYRRPNDPNRPTVGDIIQDLRRRRLERLQRHASGSDIASLPSHRLPNASPSKTKASNNRLLRTSSSRSLNSLLDEYHLEHQHKDIIGALPADPFQIETSLAATDALYSSRTRDESFLVWTLRSDLTKKTNLVNALTVKLREESLKNIELESVQKANFRLNERVKRHAEEIERLRSILDVSSRIPILTAGGVSESSASESGGPISMPHRRRRSSHKRTASLAMAASLNEMLREETGVSASHALQLDGFRVFLRKCVSQTSAMENELRQQLASLMTSSILHSRLTHLLHQVLDHKMNLELQEKSMEISHDDGPHLMNMAEIGAIGTVMEDEALTTVNGEEKKLDAVVSENRRLRIKEYEMMQEVERHGEITKEYERIEKRCVYLTKQLSGATDEKLTLRLTIEELEAALNRTKSRTRAIARGSETRGSTRRSRGF